MFEWQSEDGELRVSTTEDGLVVISVPPHGITADEAQELSSGLVAAATERPSVEAA